MALGLVQDIGALVTVRQSVRPDEYTATVNGVSVDRRSGIASGVPLSALLVADVGDIEGAPTSFTIDVKLQDSADDSAFADYGAAVAQITAANTIKTKALDLKAARRYVRAVATISFTGGTTPNAALAAYLVLAGFQELPPTQP